MSDGFSEKERILAVKFFKISELLCEIDPASTGCKENNIVDEYDYESYSILSLVEVNEESVLAIFDESFDENYNPEPIKEKIEEIKEILSE